ncbi:lipid-A-disaccharide synthase [Piscinibacter gummiphilus]|uniref:Lipid-A-disaccharide synthase n=1 Tax=Piscinibacter gummiphilus TaxID=946333 RepID=A0ABZ0D0H3_9BURK|nr:lipid-A-disaccharide synthase [Piscinibacter gummiphilus]WOB10699.1 lipid-A-disaccharide synthase [Piscinibacter gummiphilus]
MTVTTGPRLGMVAGETSGDLLAGLLLGGLKSRWPDLASFGIGGPRMAEHGFDAWWPHEKLAVRGYVEVLRHYRELVGIRNALGDRLLKERPDAFIGVDAPDFNLGLETRLKSAGIKTVHFISPSIWAWRGKRIEKIRAAADHVLCIFPFEPEIYAKHGIAASYVGHPLADAIPVEVPRAASRVALGLDADVQVVALLPGSRRSEIQYNAPRVLAAAQLMKRERPGLRFVLPAVPSLRSMIDPLVAQYAPGAGVQVLNGMSHQALGACDVTLIASGTATLEAALFKRPMVITYVMHWLTYQLMKRMAYQPWVGLPNILLRDFAVPELLQAEATPDNLARAAFKWLDDPEAGASLVRRFEGLHQQLRCNTAQAATDAIEKVLRA